MYNQVRCYFVAISNIFCSQCSTDLVITRSLCEIAVCTLLSVLY